MTAAGKRSVSRLMAAVAAIALVGAACVGYAERTLFDSEQFAHRTVSVLDAEAVQRQLSSAIADGVISEQPDAIAIRPVIEGATEAIVGAPALQRLLVEAVADLHRTLVGGETDTVTVTVADIGVLVKASWVPSVPLRPGRRSRPRPPSWPRTSPAISTSTSPPLRRPTVRRRRSRTSRLMLRRSPRTPRSSTSSCCCSRWWPA